MFLCGFVVLWLGLAPEVLATDRAGTIGFPIGSAGITVPIVPPMPNNTYSVSLQATNTAGYSTTSDCTYFNVLHKTPTQFEIQHKRCKDGIPVTLDQGVSIDWQISGHAPSLGIPGYEVLSSAVITVPGGSLVGSTQFCSQGKRITGGGFDIQSPSGGKPDAFATRSAPAQNQNGWNTNVHNKGPAPVTVQIYAVCASP
jgi:hypothetical protein